MKIIIWWWWWRRRRRRRRRRWWYFNTIIIIQSFITIAATGDVFTWPARPERFATWLPRSKSHTEIRARMLMKAWARSFCNLCLCAWERVGGFVEHISFCARVCTWACMSACVGTCVVRVCTLPRVRSGVCVFVAILRCCCYWDVTTAALRRWRNDVEEYRPPPHCACSSFRPVFPSVCIIIIVMMMMMMMMTTTTMTMTMTTTTTTMDITDIVEIVVDMKIIYNFTPVKLHSK